MPGALYLIPNTLGETMTSRVFPSHNFEVIASIRYFIVEDVRTARRFLKKTDKTIEIDALQFYLLNKHTPSEIISSYLDPIKAGFDVGIISEAGCPAIADPGAEIVRIAQDKDYQVIPLVGPSSIFLALMASGFNGQSFAFSGYLPVQSKERIQALKQLEKRSQTENQSQLFIETPYRNMKMAEDILQTCHAQTKLCIACDITLDTEYIKTKTIEKWKKSPLPNLHKRPCIFILYS